MSWVQAACYCEVHGRGQQGTVMYADARGDFSAYAGQVQLVYLDPPFMTGEDFSMRMRVGEKGWETGRDALVLPAYQDKFSSNFLALLIIKS